MIEKINPNIINSTEELVGEVYNKLDEIIDVVNQNEKSKANARAILKKNFKDSEI